MKAWLEHRDSVAISTCKCGSCAEIYKSRSASILSRMRTEDERLKRLNEEKRLAAAKPAVKTAQIPVKKQQVRTVKPVSTPTPPQSATPDDGEDLGAKIEAIRNAMKNKSAEEQAALESKAREEAKKSGKETTDVLLGLLGIVLSTVN